MHNLAWVESNSVMGVALVLHLRRRWWWLTYGK